MRQDGALNRVGLMQETETPPYDDVTCPLQRKEVRHPALVSAGAVAFRNLHTDVRLRLDAAHQVLDASLRWLLGGLQKVPSSRP